jgi:hypothetical protein
VSHADSNLSKLDGGDAQEMLGVVATHVYQFHGKGFPFSAKHGIFALILPVIRFFEMPFTNCIRTSPESL